MVVKTCSVCSNEFKTNRKEQYRCSAKCRNKSTFDRFDKLIFEQAVQRNISIAGTLKDLKLAPQGSNYHTVKKYLQCYGTDTSHWKGQGWSKNEQLKDWTTYTRLGSIRKQLILQRGNKCEQCNLETWQGVSITVEMDHIDGNKTNNDPINLRLLCPNCHSTTNTWKNRKRYPLTDSNR